MSDEDSQAPMPPAATPLDAPVALDRAPANDALARTRRVMRGDPSFFDEEFPDGAQLRAIRGLLASRDTLVACVDLYTLRPGPYDTAACTRSSDRAARRSIVPVLSTMAGAPSALGRRPFRYFSFMELQRMPRPR